MRGNHHLPFDHGKDELDARHGFEPLGGLDDIGKAPGQRPDDHMAVQPKDLVEQLFAEAVHDRQHDDQRGDAEHDADHANTAMTDTEPFLRGTQIAEGEQPLERRKRPVGSRAAGCFIRLPRDLVLAFGFGLSSPGLPSAAALARPIAAGL